MKDARPDRKIVNIQHADYRDYDLDGPVQPEMQLLPLSYKGPGQGCYVMRLEPGAETLWHEHEGVEDFLILEGELIDDDGRTLGPGDFCSYRPGSQHNSRSETGCLLIAFEWHEVDAEEHRKTVAP